MIFTLEEVVTWFTLIANINFFVLYLILCVYSPNLPCCEVNTLCTGDADLRFYVTTVQDG